MIPVAAIVGGLSILAVKELDTGKLALLFTLGIPFVLVVGFVAARIIRAAKAVSPSRDAAGVAQQTAASEAGQPSMPQPGPAYVPALPMATPQEDRFLRLSLTRKVLSRDQIGMCVAFQAQKRQQGSTIPLWDCAVLQNMLDQHVAEKLQEEAGDLDADALADFAIIRKIGQGGMGSVWLAMAPDDQLVALKLLSRELARQRPYLTRFLREAQAAMKLQHDNIVRGIAVGEEGGKYFFAMEFVAGRSVRQMIQELRALPPNDAALIVLQVARGLAYAHKRGVIHRDIKPANILVGRNGIAKLADLGLARRLAADLTELTRSGVGMGTPQYMPPEQIVEAKSADARSDIYSLGATWYHMVCGRLPFAGATALEICQKHLNEPLKPPSAAGADIPDSVSATIERMMAKEPDDRIQTADQLCQIVEQDCLAQRGATEHIDVSRLGLNATLWEMEVRSGDGMRRESLFLSEVKRKIRRREIYADTPTRPAGTDADYQPAASVPELTDEFRQA